jgi:hypothetical protein
MKKCPLCYKAELTTKEWNGPERENAMSAR